MSEREPCGAKHYEPYAGTWTCDLPSGHRGEHEAEDGPWWPREDQLETW